MTPTLLLTLAAMAAAPPARPVGAIRVATFNASPNRVEPGPLARERHPPVRLVAMDPVASLDHRLVYLDVIPAPEDAP